MRFGKFSAGGGVKFAEVDLEVTRIFGLEANVGLRNVLYYALCGVSGVEDLPSATEPEIEFEADRVSVVLES